MTREPFRGRHDIDPQPQDDIEQLFNVNSDDKKAIKRICDYLERIVPKLRDVTGDEEIAKLRQRPQDSYCDVEIAGIRFEVTKSNLIKIGNCPQKIRETICMNNPDFLNLQPGSTSSGATNVYYFSPMMLEREVFKIVASKAMPIIQQTIAVALNSKGYFMGEEKPKTRQEQIAENRARQDNSGRVGPARFGK